MNYMIKRNVDDNDIYEIFESRTEQNIMQCEDEWDAQILKTSLNNGSGFDGWTPSFFLNPPKTLIHFAVFAPELSDTVSIVCCCIIYYIYIYLFLKYFLFNIIWMEIF